MKRGEAIIMESSSTEHRAKSPQHPVWEVPTSQDRPQSRTIWRRIFPSWKGNSCQPPYPKTNNAAPAIDIASTFIPPQTSTTSGSISSSACTTDHTNQTPRVWQDLPSNPEGPSPSTPLLPTVHQSSASSSNITTTNATNATTAAKNTTNSTTTTSNPSAPVVVTSNKVLPPQSPRMERPPKLPPSQHQSQRSLTMSLPQPPATFIATSNTGSAVVSCGSPPPPPPPLPPQHRPTVVTNHSSQRNLSFSSTGSRHRRSSGDWPILTSLQQISLAYPEDGFDAQSLVTMEPYHHPDAPPAPPPPPPPMTLIDRPKCERRISFLSDFDDDDDDDDNDRDDDHLFDLSSDEDDDDGNGNGALNSGNQGTQKQAATTSKTSPISFTYSSGNKSTDTCSVSPTTVILPPPPPPPPRSSSSVTDTPDWMLEWAASTSVSGIDTPKALTKTKYDDPLYNDTEHIEQKDDNKMLQQPLPPEETETASCSTSSTDEISLSASDRTAPSEFVYLPIEPIPTPKRTEANANRKVLFCAGWAVVLFDDDVTNGTPCDSPNDDDCSALLLPEHHNYDESIYYIELLQGGTLRCTSMVGRTDENGTPRMMEMSICRNGATTVPVSPATAGACLVLRYTAIHHWGVTNEKCGNGDGSCYILPVNISTRTIDRITTSRAGQKNNSSSHKSRHHYWLLPRPIVEDESDIVHGVDETSEHDKTCALLDTEYAPQAQHDAVIFLRFALDAALQSLHV